MVAGFDTIPPRRRAPNDPARNRFLEEVVSLFYN